jgi:glutathione S-transferase
MSVSEVQRADRLDGAGPAAGPAAPPVLWHLKVSHYNEKARWALDYKGIPHVRRALPPGRHQKTAKHLAGGTTFPVLELNGQAFGDSTQIIEALERHYPEPPLYPPDPDARRKALELEDFFDEELGPHCRLLVIHHMLPDGDLTLGAFFPDLKGISRLRWRALFPLVRGRFKSALGVNDRSVAIAWEKLRTVSERFQTELRPSGYLVGDSFTVADLTLAALLGPPVAPEQFPYPQPQRNHPLVTPMLAVLSEYGLVEWTREMYARHRGSSAEISS